MIYFILVFIGVFIYSAHEKKRAWLLPLIGYSWRKFTEKVLQVPSEMAKGFATHPVASLFVICIGLGFCIITRNSEGMSLFTKITLNDLFSIIALPSFLENIPWQQGPTNREYTWKFLLFYSLHFFFLFKVSNFFDKVEVALICTYFFFFVLRWHHLNILAKQDYYINKTSAVEMVVPVQDALHHLFLTFHRHGTFEEHLQQNNDVVQEADEQWNNEHNLQNDGNPPAQIIQLDGQPNHLDQHLQTNILENPQLDQAQLERNQVDRNQNNRNRREQQRFGTLTCWSMYPIQKQFSMRVSDDLKQMKFDDILNVLVCTFIRNNQHRIQIFRLNLQKNRFNLIKTYSLPEELTRVTTCQGISNILAYDSIERAIIGFNIISGKRDMSIHIPFSDPKLLKSVSQGTSQTIIASHNLLNVSLFQRESDQDQFLWVKDIIFEEPQIDVISKQGVNKIVFHGDDGLFSFFTPNFEFIHEFNLFEGIAFQIIDDVHFSIQAFTKLFVMKNYSNPKYVAVIDHFKKIDFTLINRKKHVLFIHSSTYAGKSLLQVNQSELKRSLQMQTPPDFSHSDNMIESQFQKQNKKSN